MNEYIYIFLLMYVCIAFSEDCIHNQGGEKQMSEAAEKLESLLRPDWTPWRADFGLRALCLTPLPYEDAGSQEVKEVDQTSRNLYASLLAASLMLLDHFQQL